jgi:negative regulator of flagellin synthesis FlgM
MSDLSSIVPGGHGPVGPVNRLAAPVHLNGVHKPAAVVEVLPPVSVSGGASRLDLDRVEVSDFARHLDTLLNLPDVRFERIASVRQAIADGSYDTEDKIDVAIERMLEEEFQSD